MSDRSLPIVTAGRNTINSPCVRNCCLDEDDVCMGCFRSVEEIIRWSSAGSDERRTILQNAGRRKQTRTSGNPVST